MIIEGTYPKLLDSTIDEIIKEISEQTEQYIVKRLVSLDIDTDVLERQTMEIQRLQDELDKYRWIPVTERLPEDDPANDYYTVVMVTLADGSVTAGFYRNDNCEWWSLHIDEFERVKYNKAIAWMPLPSPYEEVGE